MSSSTSSSYEQQLFNLIKKLREECEYVNSEKKQLLELHRQVLDKSEQIYFKSSIISLQRLILDDLILSRNRLSLNQQCTLYTKLNKTTQFLQSYKQLSHYDYKISDLLKQLYTKPQYLAYYLYKSENKQQQYFISSKLSNFNQQTIISTVFSSIYANCLLPNDELCMLKLLKHLIELTCSSQIDDYRRIIRKQSCTFNILFKYYTEFVYSARLFLTAALNEPILQLLMHDEWYYDIDPDKAVVRFSHEEQQKRFGTNQNSKEYKAKVQEHREFIVDKLYKLTMSFIDSINKNIYLFPTSLISLVSHLYSVVNKSKSQQQDARRLCCDLIMALYICPAIVDPEPYGVISDIPISTIGRHNLTQIAVILQVLAMSDDKEPKTQDLYSKFRSVESNTNLVSDILNSIIIQNPNEGQQNVNLYQMESNATNNNPFIRTSVIMSLSEINKLIVYLHELSKDLDQESDECKFLKQIIPQEYLSTIHEITNTNNTNENQASIKPSSSFNSLQNLVNLKPQQQLQQPLAKPNSLNNLKNIKKPTAKPNDKDPLSLNNLLANNHSNDLLNSANQNNSSFTIDPNEPLKLLILTINDKGYDCPGMITEEKVIQEYELINKSKELNNSINCALGSELNDDRCSSSDKISRYNNDYLDEEELENVNCNQSISSTDNDENDDAMMNNNDDLAFINVGQDALTEFSFSGRNTPIISGRDTPSSLSHDDNLAVYRRAGNSSTTTAANQTNTNNANSSNVNINSNNNLVNMSNNNNNSQINSNMNSNSHNNISNNLINFNSINNLSNMNIPRGPQLPVTVQKQNREDINEKFCKFEINKENVIIKEEQTSEAGWSLDADPPESIITESEQLNDEQNLTQNSTQQNSSINNDNSNFLKMSDKTDNNAQQNHQQQRQQSTISSQQPNRNSKSPLVSLFNKNPSNSNNNKSKSTGLTNPFSKILKPKNNKTSSVIDSTEPPTQTADQQQAEALNILEKYRKQSSVSLIPPTQAQTTGLLIDIDDSSAPQNSHPEPQQQQQQQPQQQFYDPSNFEQCKAFLDAKKKLRMVLSWSDYTNSSYSLSNYNNSTYAKVTNKENYLYMFLKAQFYEAISLKDTEKEAHLDETMRCVQQFSEVECKKLLKSLNHDYKKRIYYIQYLTKSKQALLYSNTFLDKLLKRVEWQQKLLIGHFTTVVTRQYLESKEASTQMFVQKFQKLVATDEKFELFRSNFNILKSDFNLIWINCNQDEIDFAHLCMERLLMSRVYSYAMFPNGEIDHFRDIKAYECLQNLSAVITPSHQLIAIPSLYHNEAPWTLAQVELKRINAYKTPQDKLKCIEKCMNTIQNLLSIAKTPVNADDIQPVLIYVIIKANPPTFLSTVQYIESYYSNKLDQEFYWAQFMFAFSYIKAKLLIDS